MGSDQSVSLNSSANDNRSNQCNPNNSLWQGFEGGYHGKGDKADLDNHANQLNPNNWRFNGGSNK